MCALSHANNVLFLGDLNCDILHPDHKLKGKDLFDLCDVFNLHALTKEKL